MQFTVRGRQVKMTYLPLIRSEKAHHNGGDPDLLHLDLLAELSDDRLLLRIVILTERSGDNHLDS